MLHKLEDLDSLTVYVIVDNELDPLSPGPTSSVHQSGGIVDIALRSTPLEPQMRAGAFREIRMDGICCGLHGLSLLITGEKDGQKRTILFDAGPEEDGWQRNAERLGLTEVVGKHLERIVLSHWHRDHSGGMLRVLRTVGLRRETEGESERSAVVVDVHPERPFFRGVLPPGMAPLSFEADPTFEEIEKEGGKIERHKESHTVLDDMFLVSGEIPRKTAYEKGLKFGARLDEENGSWIMDEAIMDERFLMCRVKDKGIVVFTGCSHAGIVNVSQHAKQLGGDLPLYALIGGYHLADAQPDTQQATLRDLKSLDPQVLLAGHCTGWRAKFAMQKEFPERLVPSFVGAKFVF